MHIYVQNIHTGIEEKNSISIYLYITISFHEGKGVTSFLVNAAPPVPTTIWTVAWGF